MALQTLNWTPNGLSCVIVLQWDNTLGNPTHNVLSVSGSTSPFTPPVVGQNIEGSAFLTAYLAAQPVQAPPVLAQPGTIAVIDAPSLTATQTGQVAVPSNLATGLYRITGYLKKNIAATTSSTLGPLTITFTAADGTSITATMAFANSAGTLATSNAINATGATAIQSMVPFTFFAKTGSPITYTLTYASVGATVMQYEAHFRVESL